MNKLNCLTAAFVFLILGSTSALASDCGYSRCWGAVAIGPGGAWGWSHSHGSEQAAVDSAQKGCQWNCDVIRTFYNTCGAISADDGGIWGFGWASTRNEAEGISMDYCLDGGYNCAVRVWACSH